MTQDIVQYIDEKDLSQEQSLALTDFVRVVGSDENSYKQSISDLAQLIVEGYETDLGGFVQTVKDALDALPLPASEYDASATYAVGEYCLYDGGLYRCVTAITTAEEWTLAHWEEVTIGGVLQDIATTLETKADINGDYPTLIAGNADHLLSDEKITDTAPYLFRRTGGGNTRIGYSCIPTIVGGSVVGNQLVADTGSGLSVTVPSGHKYYSKVSGTQTIGASTGTAITGLSGGTDMVIDLTQKLGSAIADRAYTMEQSTAGSGIAWLKSYGFISDSYEAYDTGTLKSVEATAHKTYDADDNLIGNYPLGNVTLRGIPKVDANDNIYYDGDTYTADGTVGRRWFKTELDGTHGVTNFQESTNTCRFSIPSTQVTPIIKPNNSTVSNIITDFTTYPPDYIYTNDVEGISENKNASANGFWIRIAKSKLQEYSVNGMKAYLASNPITVIYELATPTTETADPFQSPQIVDPSGTEDWVTDNGVPVGSVTEYNVNLKGKLETLPDFPTSAGEYKLKVTVTSGVPSYSWEAIT